MPDYGITKWAITPRWLREMREMSGTSSFKGRAPLTHGGPHVPNGGPHVPNLPIMSDWTLLEQEQINEQGQTNPCAIPDIER